MIPKTIYYAWFGGNEIPQNVKANIESWQDKNPSYEIKQINESNFDVESFNFTSAAYHTKKWAFVSDVARLSVLYKNGGFYFDTDVELLESLDNLRTKTSIWGLENSNAINSGLIIGAQKGDKDLAAILDIYKTREFKNNNEDITVALITNYFHKKGFLFKNKRQTLNSGAVIYPTEYFAPYHWWGGGKVTKRTISIHKYGASWLNDKNKKNSLKIYLTMELLYLFPQTYYRLRFIKNNFF